MVSSPPKIESVTENTNKPSTKPSTSQSLLEIENVQQNGTAAAIGSSLLKIVDERGNGTKNRRSNNIILNEEIQKEERADKKQESIATKTKRLKLIEVVHLLREITNIEMDLRFEAAAANELYENTKNDFGVSQIGFSID